MEKRSESSNKSGGNKKKIILAVLSAVVIVAGVFLFTIIKDSRMVKQADSLVAIGKYENGIMIYDDILTKKMSVEVMGKRDNAIDLMEANENYEQGIEALDNDDRYKAIKYFLKVPENDQKLYEKASNEISDIEDMTASDAEELIADKDFIGAYKVINEHLKVAPNSSKVSNLKETLIATEKEVNKKNAVAKAEEDKKIAEVKNAEEKQAKAIEDERKSQEAKALVVAKNKETEKWELEQAKAVAGTLVGSTRYVTSDIGNLRDAPTLNGNLIDALPKGTEVYIMDTHVENIKRTWCRVDVYIYGDYHYTGWISYNTLNNSIP